MLVLFKKIIFILLITILSLSFSSGVCYAQYSVISQFLCERGIKFYKQGDYMRALQEFNKALLAYPNHPLALEYIEKIKRMELASKKRYVAEERFKEIEKILERFEKKVEMPRYVEVKKIPSLISKEKIALPKKEVALSKLFLDESLKTLMQPIEIEKDKGILIMGKNIQRFLLVQPDIIGIEKRSSNELMITGKEIGRTYLHIWDENGHWILEFRTVPAQPEGP
ncbi:MAG: pilus assembly protein N-terminal domain-containing protein, partial [Candidatus Omnitrophica bacterium]|nr:pilus assembly protein N-terminal domain-containing protein [Candidatus Omnitrophota bacterium]